MPSVARPPAGRPSASPSHIPLNGLVLSESQWLFEKDELNYTPSVLAGLPPAKERENRAKGVNFISQVGIMLKLPQITLATASVYLHRFFMRYSMVDEKAPDGTVIRPQMHYYSVGATSLFLATKVDENGRKKKELVVACVKVAQKNPNKIVAEQDKEFWRWKDTILQMEDLLLEAICFDLTIDPPYKVLFELLVANGESENRKVRNTAWAFLNDSSLTMLCLLFTSRTIAASALYAAAKHCNVRFPDDEQGRPWWEVAGVELRNIRRACNFMADVYENSPLRAGTEGTIYERTPEDGDESSAKTRAPSDHLQHTPRASSVLSNAGSDISRKRKHDEDEGGGGRGAGSENSQNGHNNGLSQMSDITLRDNNDDGKKRRIDEHTTPAAPGASGIRAEDDVSEEGEVDEP